MKNIFLKHRLDQKSFFSEKRLCYKTTQPSNQPSDGWIDTASKYVKDGVEWTADKFTKVIVDFNEGLIRIGAGIPMGIMSGMKKGFESFPTQKDAEVFLHQVKDFFSSVPGIRRFFPPEQDIRDIETIRKLTNHTEWINVFRNRPSILEIPPNKEPLPNSGPFGPEQFLLSLDPLERQALYIEYVDSFIPPEVQYQAGGDAWMETDVSKKYEGLKASMPTVNTALGGIMGIDGWEQNKDADTDLARNIAQASLQSYYGIDGSGVTEGIANDYSQALKYQKLAGIHGIATDPNALMSHIGPSRFRGALLTGTVNKDDLNVLGAGLAERDHALRVAEEDIRKNLNYFTEATREGYKKEAETLRDTFNNLGGPEKLILVGALIYGLMKSKTVRMTAGILTGAYFFQKMVLKQEDPVKGWSQLVNKVTGKAKDANATIFGSEWTPGHVEKVSGRANVIRNFLDDYSTEHITRQGIAFGILHDIPLGTFADHFYMNGKGGEAMMLDIDNKTFRKQIADVFDRRGWSRSRFNEFFDWDQQNKAQASDAISFVFFLKAAERPENKQRTEMILETLRMMHPGTSLAVFAHSGDELANNIQDEDDRERFLLAHKEYIRLVADGQQMSVDSKMSLGQFMAEHQGFEFVPEAVPPVMEAELNTAPTIPPSGRPAPSLPGSGFKAPHIPLSGSTAPESPKSGSEAPSTPLQGSTAPAAPAEGASAPTVPNNAQQAPENSNQPPAAPSSPSGATPAPKVP